MGVEGKTLQLKIDELVTKNLLAKPQADALHEERYLGNVALHEIERPSQADLEDGLEIVEGLLFTIFVLPLHATRMKKKREERKKKNRTSRARAATHDDFADSLTRFVAVVEPLRVDVNELVHHCGELCSV